ncbi:MAG: RDD family protein [Pyrinomonadaceae bacterium]|nr:RDD family protein [Pyrinomonadaceae bacterium]
MKEEVSFSAEISDVAVEAQPAQAAPAASTLIEFPGAGRAARPQWRKDLSERVRVIQERRARDAQAKPKHLLAAEASAPQLGLVPQPDQPEVNPIVVAALRRIERAYHPPPTRSRSTKSGAAVAVAHVAEEQYLVEHEADTRNAPALESLPLTEKAVPERQPETAREHTLTVVPAKPIEKAATVITKTVAPRIITEPLNEFTLDARSFEAIAAGEFYDDRAPVLTRMAAGLIDMLVIAFASSPFAAIIELTNGNWADERVLASMGGIFVLIMFLYLTTSTALAGRTWGMSLVSLRAVDVDTGLHPTTKQSVTRAVAYMLSLATLGLGILYALFDAEGRTAHDHLSGTAVVRE